jgi:hypothetical protein
MYLYVYDFIYITVNHKEVGLGNEVRASQGRGLAVNSYKHSSELYRVAQQRKCLDLQNDNVLCSDLLVRM